jgi:SAM-dependent methyltransferase
MLIRLPQRGDCRAHAHRVLLSSDADELGERHRSPQADERQSIMGSTYDKIGVGYALTRRSDPHIAAQIIHALGDAASVANIGAGTGSYEPADRTVVAVEPSATMIRQRPPGSAPVIRGTAESLPLVDDAVDSATALLTVHHWTDPARGFAEMLRVARRRVVILTWDPTVWESFWLIREYFPASDVDGQRAVPIADIVSALGESQILPVSIPHDCVDGLQGAFWRRPASYLDARVRSAISAFATMPRSELDDGLRRLGADIRSGDWEDRHRELLELDEADLGYRLIVAAA